MLPGELIGTEEEYLEGKGTYSEHGNIRSYLVGKLSVDANRHATIVPYVRIPELKAGTVVYGRVVEMFESVAFVDLEIPVDPASMEQKKKRIVAMSGVIPVSEIKGEYVRSIRDELRVGDIIKGTIVKVTPFRLEVSLKAKGMGVVQAFCSYDRQLMNFDGRTLKCGTCGKIDRRKLAMPYGKP
jgi:exosome complex component CSL4